VRQAGLAQPAVQEGKVVRAGEFGHQSVRHLDPLEQPVALAPSRARGRDVAARFLQAKKL
jgi:hypothetical protein